MLPTNHLLALFVQKVGMPTDVFVAEAATKAVAGFAVVAGELDEGLRVGCRFAVDAGVRPCAGDVVLFGFDLFEQVEGPFAEGFIALVAPVGEEERGDAVDDEQVF